MRMGACPIHKPNQTDLLRMDVERKCLKKRCKEFSGPKVFLGNGEVQFDRKDIFNPSNKAPSYQFLRGVGVQMCDPVWKQPSLSDVIEDWGFPQNLPSVLCGHVLDPKPRHRVLDMCPVPGGKSTHIAQLMDDSAPLLSPLDWKSQTSLWETEAGFIQKFDPRKFCGFPQGDWKLFGR